MGCANRKPIGHGSDCTSRPQKANKKSFGKRKPMRMFLRTLLFGNSKSSRIEPAEISSTRPNSPPPFNSTTSNSAERLHEIFCSGTSSNSDAIHCEEVPVATDGETNDHESDSDSLTSISEEEFREESDHDETENIRNERYRARAIRNLEEVATLKDELKALERSQEENEMERKLLEALKISALQSPEPARRLTKLNASVEKLSKTYTRQEKELYVVKGKRAIGEAKVDYFLTKLNPGMKYSDIYANNNSYYLFPIPEENEEQTSILEE